MSFIDSIFERAKSDIKRIVLPEATDERVLTAARKLAAEAIAEVVLVGNEAEVRARAEEYGVDISACKLVDPATDARTPQYEETFYELRKKKGMTPEKAKAQMQDPVYFGCMMVKQGDADGMVSGAIHSTAETLRPALQIVKTAPGTKLVSAFFLMVVPDCEYGENGTFVFGDCGLNENPDADQLSEIAISSAKSFEQLTGKSAKVAMLSYSTKGSAKSELTDKVVEATRITMEKAPDLAVDGELQLDAALVDSVAKSKAPGSKVAGNANVLIFPDLNAGNIGYKLVQRLAKAEAYGPVTQGIAAPVNDLSRGCNAEDIVGVAAITAVQAQTK